MHSTEQPAETPQGAELRRQAEQQLQTMTDTSVEAPADTDARALVHELHVHQIELEMQNKELLRAQAIAKELSNRYADLFDFAPVACFVWDAQGQIQEVNLAGATLLGLERNTTINRRFGRFLVREDRPAFAGFCQRVVSAGGKQTCEARVLNHQGTIPVRIEAVSVPDWQGKGSVCLAAVIAINCQPADGLGSHDVTELQRAQEARRLSEERLALALDAAELGPWEIDLASEEVIASPRVRAIFGVDDQHPLATRADWRAFVVAEDRPVIQRAIAAAADGNAQYRVEFRVRRPADGAIRWLRSEGRLYKDARGRRVRMVGVVADITRHKLAEAERQRLLSILEATPDMVSYATPDGRVEYMNRSGRARFGIPLEAELGDRPLTASRPEWVGKLLAETGLPTALREGMWVGETVVLTEDGREIPVSQLLLAHRDPDGTITHVSSICRDITELKRVEEALRETNEALSRFNRVAVGRELRMIELKKEVNQLCRQAGQPARYPLEFENEPWPPSTAAGAGKEASP